MTETLFSRLVQAVAFCLMGGTVSFTVSRYRKDMGKMFCILGMLLGGMAGALFGCSAESVMLLLLYPALYLSSLGDIRTHRMSDAYWIFVLGLSVCRIGDVGILPWLFGGMAVFLPQFILLLTPAGSHLNGADLKMSAALGCLATGWYAPAGLLLSELAALTVMGIRALAQKGTGQKPFAMIPFLSFGFGTAVFLSLLF